MKVKVKGKHSITRDFQSLQWCNLLLTWLFWANKVHLLASNISKKCLVGCPTAPATSWKANFENCSRYFLIKWYPFISILCSMSNTSFHFRHPLLLSSPSSQSHAISYSSPMSHYQVTNKCNRLNAWHWRWLIFALYIFLLHNSRLHVCYWCWSLTLDFWKLIYENIKKKYSFQNKHLHIQITDILKFYVVLLFTNCKGLGFFLSSKNSHYAYIHPYMHKILPILGNKIEQ